MSSSLTDSKAFLDDFKLAGGWYDHETFGLSEFDQMGWGGIALKDIPVSLFPVRYQSRLTGEGTHALVPYPTGTPLDTIQF
jgi:hypothetical protein